jgi:3-oxoacyl-[acyl-carrier-protein] synthase-3
LPQASLQALQEAGVPLEDVKLIVPHQANTRIIEAAGKKLGVDASVMANNIARYGNTSTASIPLALKEALDAGRVQPGDHIVLVAFGAGLTWAACVIEWEAPIRSAA